MNQYPALPGFEYLYLEDSWVLGIHEYEKSFHIDLEAVATEQHPRWHGPEPGKQYCYLRARIEFDNVQATEWIWRHMRPSEDPDGSIDFGNIDSFVYEDDRYELEGSWGRVVVESPSAPLVHEL